MHQFDHDIGIVGGGLAGLSLSIQLAAKGYSVVLFEKEHYPFHRVCGEYISNESRPFLESLGLDLKDCPSIKKLLLTSPNGKSVYADLPLGGFGMSRYKLDSSLFQLAEEAGVKVFQGVKVENVEFTSEAYVITSANSDSTIKVRICCGAFGKRSNIDVKWQRSFLEKQDKKLDNFVGVKYHVSARWPEELIGLHNFENGYCGISAIEGGKYCLCYMTRSDDLKRYQGDLEKFQEKILFKNPFLKNIFLDSTVLPGFPVTIAQINFQEKEQVKHEVIMIGDAAGMITPLCGNGMSIAFHTSKLAADAVENFLTGKMTLRQAQQYYTDSWKQAFSRRLSFGRQLQKLFGKTQRSNRFVSLLRFMPFLKKPIIRLTHGRPF